MVQSKTSKCGVYRVFHIETGQEYIGSSIKIEDRIAHHMFCLRANRHSSGMLQTLWNKTATDEWDWEILEECQPEHRINREQFYIDNSERLLNHLLVAGSTQGRKWSEASRIKARESRKRYLETPGARESLAERARKQHAAGKLGQSTWVSGHPMSNPDIKARRKQKEAENREKGIKRVIDWTPEERQKRSKRMKQMHIDRKLGTHTVKPETFLAASERMKQLHASGKLDPVNISDAERARRSQKMKELNAPRVAKGAYLKECRRKYRDLRLEKIRKETMLGREEPTP